MHYTLQFDQQIDYDAGLSGITLELALETAKQRVSLEAKLDTGASECIVAHRYAGALGLDIELGWPIDFATATGRFRAYRHEVTLVVHGYRFDAGVCFATDERFNRNVLGRRGFLDRVNVGIIDYEGKLYLSRYGDDLPA